MSCLPTSYPPLVPQWYPLAIASDCDPRRPLAVSLLGQELVLWRDGSGGWHAHADACPHRLAPL